MARARASRTRRCSATASPSPGLPSTRCGSSAPCSAGWRSRTPLPAPWPARAAARLSTTRTKGAETAMTTTATEADVLEAMKQVEDPELGVNVVDLGLVYGVELLEEGRAVRLDMTLTTAACPLTDMIEGATNAALVGMGGIQEVEINWVWTPPWGPDRLTEDGRFALRSMGFAI